MVWRKRIYFCLLYCMCVSLFFIFAVDGSRAADKDLPNYSTPVHYPMFSESRPKQVVWHLNFERYNCKNTKDESGNILPIVSVSGAKPVYYTDIEKELGYEVFPNWDQYERMPKCFMDLVDRAKRYCEGLGYGYKYEYGLRTESHAGDYISTANGPYYDLSHFIKTGISAESDVVADGEDLCLIGMVYKYLVLAEQKVKNSWRDEYKPQANGANSAYWDKRGSLNNVCVTTANNMQVDDKPSDFWYNTTGYCFPTGDNYRFIRLYLDISNPDKLFLPGTRITDYNNLFCDRVLSNQEVLQCGGKVNCGNRTCPGRLPCDLNSDSFVKFDDYDGKSLIDDETGVARLNCATNINYLFERRTSEYVTNHDKTTVGDVLIDQYCVPVSTPFNDSDRRYIAADIYLRHSLHCNNSPVGKGTLGFGNYCNNKCP